MSHEAERPTLHVIVGSTNPVKLAAVRAVLERIYGPPVQIRAVAVPSGVPAQPWGDAETRAGAVNRARAALALGNGAVAFGIGLEGGLLRVAGEVYTSAWCAVARAGGQLGIAGGENMQLPPAVVAALEAGLELGHAIDCVTGTHNSKHKDGAIGAFTGGFITRQTAYEHLLTLALARFLSPEHYPERDSGEYDA